MSTGPAVLEPEAERASTVHPLGARFIAVIDLKCIQGLNEGGRFFTSLYVYIYIHFFKHLFIFERQRERDRVRMGKGQRERETQKQKQAPGSEPSAQSPMWGWNPPTVRS